MQFQAELVWFLVGLALAFLEFMAPGVILVFFGAGAWITALTTWMNLTNNLPWQMLVFAASSLALLVLLRRYLRGRFLGHSGDAQDPNVDLDDFVGKTVVVIEAIAPGKPGKVEFKGASWSASADRSFDSDDRVVIRRLEGLTLEVGALASSPSSEEEAPS